MRPHKPAGSPVLPSFPFAVEPQLATLVQDAPAGDEWLHEMKFDGYRILGYVAKGVVHLKSRRGIDWTDKFPGITAALGKLPVETALIDGEVAVPMPDGRTSFTALQEALSAGAARGVIYFAFDLLHLDGRALVKVPLEARKLTLRALLTAAPAGLPLRFSDHVVGRGREFFAQVRARGLEGIVSKRRADVHRPGRSQGWLKIKATSRQEFVVGGYTDPEGSRTAFGSLLLGVYDDAGALHFSGGVGTGFTDGALRDLGRRLQPLAQKDCPFVRKPTAAELRRPAHWLRPDLVVEVEFLEWTSDGHIRHPSFRGLREDRDPRDIRRETPVADAVPSSAAPPAAQHEPTPSPELTTPSPAAIPGAASPVTSSRSPLVLGQRISHPDRAFYPALGITKLGLARFYEAVGAAMVPHVRGRPLTLVRCPEGVAGDCFYSKHVATGARTPLGQIMIKERDTEVDKPEPFLVIRDHAGIVALAQLGVLEIHTWNSTEDSVDFPDRFVMDLDPGPDVPWTEVIDAAKLVRDVLRAVGLESFVKTTGGKGLHVVVPLAPVLNWDACLELSRAIAGLVVKQQPRRYTTALPKAGREKKILLDFYRNHRGATSVAAFSTRSRPEATVSVPIAWDELSPGLRSGDFTVTTVPERMARLGADPWAGYWENQQTLRPDLAGLLGAKSG
jgi:bifunctional non-homologous end joining protein LigD